jgi:TRAP-type mannitol/chloroaromatic compound transport system permease small subunit
VAPDGVVLSANRALVPALLEDQGARKRVATAMTNSLARTPTPSPGYLAVIRTIDRFTDVTAHVFVVVIVPLILANVVEVFARYVLQAPTMWALDVTTMSYATLFMLGAALALLKGAHVRTDMLWEGFSDRTKGMIDSLALTLLFLPTMAVLFFISIDDFFYAVSIDERSSSGAWTPVLWPLRGVIPLTFFMLFLQGISELLKSLWAWRTGQFLAKHEKIEV